MACGVQINSVKKCIFHFLGARIWVPMPAYRYESPSEYVTDGLLRYFCFWSSYSSCSYFCC